MLNDRIFNIAELSYWDTGMQGRSRAVLSYHGPPGHKSLLGARLGGSGHFGGGPGAFGARAPGNHPRIPSPPAAQPWVGETQTWDDPHKLHRNK